MAIITDIEVQKNNKDRANIYIDYEYTFSCDLELVYTHNIKIKENIDLEYIIKIVEQDNYIKAKNYALKIIEKSYKTEKEIKNRLVKIGYEDLVICKVVEFLKEYEFINDLKYVGLYVKDKSKTQGRNKIKYSLLTKGIEEDIIENKLNEMGTNLELEVAIKIAKKKYILLVKKEQDIRKIKQKLAQFLVGKGYSWDLINKAIKNIVNGNEFEDEYN